MYYKFKTNPFPTPHLRDGDRDALNAPPSLLCTSWSFFFFTAYALNIPVSRRSTNISYALWVTATNVTMLYALDKTAWKPEVMDVVNRNGLATFLVANLGTGAVNLATDTMTWGNGACGVVAGYMAGVLGAAWVIDEWKRK